MRGSQRTDNLYDTAFPNKFRVEDRYAGSDLPVSELIKKNGLADYVPGMPSSDAIHETIDEYYRESLSNVGAEPEMYQYEKPDNYRERSQRILNVHYGGLQQGKSPDMPEMFLGDLDGNESNASFAPGPDYALFTKESWTRARYNQNFFSSDADNKIVDNGYNPVLIYKNNMKNRNRIMNTRNIFDNSQIAGNRSNVDYHGVKHKSLNEVYDVGDIEMDMRINSLDAENVKAVREYRPSTFRFNDDNSELYEKMSSIGVTTNPLMSLKSSTNGREYIIEGQKYKNAFTPDARSIGKNSSKPNLVKTTERDNDFDDSDKSLQRKRMIDVVNNLLHAKKFDQLIDDHNKIDNKEAKQFDKNVQELLYHIKSDRLNTNNDKTYLRGKKGKDTNTMDNRKTVERTQLITDGLIKTELKKAGLTVAPKAMVLNRDTLETTAKGESTAVSQSLRKYDANIANFSIDKVEETQATKLHTIMDQRKQNSKDAKRDNYNSIVSLYGSNRTLDRHIGKPGHYAKGRKGIIKYDPSESELGELHN